MGRNMNKGGFMLKRLNRKPNIRYFKKGVENN